MTRHMLSVVRLSNRPQSVTHPCVLLPRRRVSCHVSRASSVVSINSSTKWQRASHFLLSNIADRRLTPVGVVPSGPSASFHQYPDLAWVVRSDRLLVELSAHHIPGGAFTLDILRCGVTPPAQHREVNNLSAGHRASKSCFRRIEAREMGSPIFLLAYRRRTALSGAVVHC
jgi:hypothetical protein